MKFKRKLAIFLSAILAVQTIMPAQLAAASPDGRPGSRNEADWEEEDDLEWGDTVDLLALENREDPDESFEEWQEQLERGEKASASSASGSNANQSTAFKLNKKARAYEPVYQPDKNSIASPADAFKSLTIETKTEGGEPVKVKDKKVALAFRLTLDDDYLGAKLQTFFDDVEANRVSGFTQDDMTNRVAVDNWINDEEGNNKDIVAKYFPDISFHCTIEGNSFQTPTDTGNEWEDLISVSREKLGRYRIKKIEGSGNLLLECQLARHLYNRIGVSAYQSFELELNSDENEGKYPQITAGEGGVDVKIKYIFNTSHPDNIEGSYDFSKIVDDSTAFPVISYTIHAELTEEASESADLCGKYITDTLPKEIELIEANATVVYEGGDTLESQIASDAETGELQIATASEAWSSTTKRKISFHVPFHEEEENKKATEVTINMVTQLTADTYKKYLEGTLKEIKIGNKAYLAKNDSPNDSNAMKTDEAPYEMGVPFFNKDGTAAGDLKGEKWKWEIDMNPYFTSASKIYLIDHIPDTALHIYDNETSSDSEGEQIQIVWHPEAEGDSDANKTEMILHYVDINSLVDRVEESVKPSDNTQWYSYSNLTKDRVTGSRAADRLIQAARDNNPIGEGDGIYFIYEEGGRKQALYIAPVPSAYWKTPVNITYYTKMTVERTETDQPADLKKELENDAAIVWEEATYGPGPGTNMDINVVTMGKKTVANYSVLEKKAIAYDEKTQLVTWEFDVNRYGADLGKFTITDEFQEGIQELSIHSEGIPIQEINRETEAEGDWEYIGNLPNSGQKYYYVVNEEEKDNSIFTTLTIVFKNITAEECYRIRLTTKLKDPSILKNQNSTYSGQAINVATYTFDAIENSGKKYVVEGVPIDVPNTWIEKSKESFITTDGKTYDYDYENHLMKWKVIVNPNHLPVSSAVLTDILPTIPADSGEPVTDFYRWEGVRRFTGDNLENKENATDGSGGIGVEVGKMDSSTATPSVAEFNEESGGDKVKITLETEPEKNKAVFKFTNQNEEPVTIHDCYEFIFTTRIKDEYRKKGLITDIENTAKLINHAEFTGYYQNLEPDIYEKEENHVLATASAENSPNVRPGVKKGQYHPFGEGSAYQYGDDVVDISWIEWEIALNRDRADMTGITMVDTMKEWYELDTDSLKIYTANVNPDGSYEKGGEVSKSELGENLSYSNSALSFKIPENYGKTPLILCFNTIITDTVSASNMKNTVTLYGADGNAMSKDEVQADGAKDFNFDDFIKASTAPFVRIKKGSSNSVIVGSGKDQSFKYPLSGATFELSPMEFSEDDQTWRETNDQGKRKVTNTQGICNFIPLKRDVLYQLKEIAAPDGYEVKHTNYYFLLDGTNKKQVGDRLEDENAGIKIEESRGSGSGKVTLGYGNYTEDGILYHSTDTSDHYLMKMISNGPSPHNQVMVSFYKKTEEGEPVAGAEFELISEKLKKRILTSNEDGYVELKDVDAGTYDLVETKTPEGFVPIVKGDVTVSVAGTIDDPAIDIDGKYVEKAENGNVTIINKPLRTNLKLSKQTPDNLPLRGAEFVLSLDDAGNEPVAFLRQKDDTSVEGTSTNPDYVLTTEKSEAYEAFIEDAGLPGELVEKKEMVYFENRILHASYVSSDGLLDGTYYLREYLEPAHFEIDTNTYQITLSNGKVTNIRVEKQPDGMASAVKWDDAKNQLIFTDTASTEVKGHKYALYYDADGNAQRKPLAGICFNLYDQNGNMVREGGRNGEEVSNEGVSQADGTFAFYGVAYGTYYVAEAANQKVTGYERNETVYQVKVVNKIPVGQGVPGDSSDHSDFKGTPENIVYDNVHKNGTIRINKVDAEESEQGGILKHVDFDVFTSAGSKICRLILDKTESCYTLPAPDSDTDLVVNEVGEPYLTRQADSDTPALIAGSYYVVETNPEPGYYRDMDEEGNLIHHELTITGGENCVITNEGVTEDESQVFTNRKAEFSMSVQKWVETESDSPAEKAKKKADDGYRFRITYQDTESDGLFAGETISRFATVKEGVVTATPSEAKAGNWMEAETGQEGRIILDDLLPGTYRVTELEKSGLTEPYQLPEGKTYILKVDDKNEIALNDEAGNEIVGNAIDVVNWWKRYTINGNRCDSETKEGLEGAEIGLFPAGTTEFTKENLYNGQTAISDKDGNFRFEDVPYGSFVVAELEAPDGYDKNTTTSYTVEAKGEEKEIGKGHDGTQETEIVIGSQKKPEGEDGKDEPDDNKPDNKPDDNIPDDNNSDNKPDDNTPDNKPDNKPDGNTPDDNKPDNTPDDNNQNSGNSNQNGSHGKPSGNKGDGNQTGPGVTPQENGSETGNGNKYPSLPENPPEVPTEQKPGGTTVIKVPVTEETDVEILNSKVESVYRGRTDQSGRIEVELPPDNYTLVLLDDEAVPLAYYGFTIDGEIGKLPKTGDRNGVPFAMIATVLLGVVALELYFSEKKREKCRKN